MPTRRAPAVAALAGWTLFVWTTRVGNIWRDQGLDVGEKLGRTGLALSFTLLAAAVLVAHVQRRGWLVPAVRALAAWTTVVWVVRSVGIVGDHHSAAFVVVHLVLAIVSVTLAGLAVGVGRGRATTSSPQASEAE